MRFAFVLFAATLTQRLFAGAPVYPCDVPNCAPFCMDAQSVFHVSGRDVTAKIGNTRSVSGDFNGDNRPDLAVTENRYRTDRRAPVANEVYVYYNTGSGYSSTPSLVIRDFYPPASNKGANAHHDLSAGDLNGDGYDELAVGTSDDTYDSRYGRGQVWIHAGSAAGLSATPVWTQRSPVEADAFGRSVAIVPNYFSPGVGALAVGAPDHNGRGCFLCGRVYIYKANLLPSYLDNAFVRYYEGESRLARFGSETWSTGDINGDGLGELAVAAPYHQVARQGMYGKVYLYLGAATAPLNADWTDLGALSTSPGLGYMERMSLGSGDFNGDNRADLVLGMPYDDGIKGSVRVYLSNGSLPGPAQCLSYSVNGNKRFGISVAGVPDMNGDGFEDLVVGQDANYHRRHGNVIGFAGSAAGILPCATMDIGPNLYPEQPTQPNYMGQFVNSMGDVNGDGFGDFLIASPQYFNRLEVSRGATQGRIDVVLGQGQACNAPGPRATATPTSTRTATKTVTLSRTATSTRTASPSITAIRTETPTATLTTPPEANECWSTELYSDAGVDRVYYVSEDGPSPLATPDPDGGVQWHQAGYSEGAGWGDSHCQAFGNAIQVPLSVVRPAGSYCTPYYGPQRADWLQPVEARYVYGGRDRWYVRRSISLPAGSRIVSAKLHFTADNLAFPWVDGNSVPVPSQPGWGSIAGPIDLTPYFSAGSEHVLAFEIRNTDDEDDTQPSGLSYRLELDYCSPDGKVTATPTPVPVCDGCAAFCDDFEGAQSSLEQGRWNVLGGSATRAVPGGELIGQALVLVPSAVMMQVELNGYNSLDQDLRTRVRSEGGAVAALMGRVQGTPNPGVCETCYLLVFNNSVGPADIAIDRRVGNSQVRLAMTLHPNVPASAYDLRLSIIDRGTHQELRGYLNGTLVISVDDSSPSAISSAGTMAFSSYGVNWLDEIVADPLDCTVVRTATPTVSPTATPSATASMTATPSGTASATATATPSETPTATPSSTTTATPSETPTATPSSTATATPSETPTATPSSTTTATPSETPTATPSSTATATPSETPTSTPSPTPTATPLTECWDTQIFADAGVDQVFFVPDTDPNPLATPPAQGGYDWNQALYSEGSGWSPAPCQAIAQAIATIPVSAPRAAGSYCSPYYGPQFADWLRPVADRYEHNAQDRWYTRHRFSLPAGAEIESAELVFTADNAATPYVDGQLVTVGAQPGWGATVTLDVSTLIDAGPDHVIAFLVQNQDTNNTQPTGLSYRLDIRYCAIEGTVTATPTPVPVCDGCAAFCDTFDAANHSLAQGRWTVNGGTATVAPAGGELIGDAVVMVPSGVVMHMELNGHSRVDHDLSARFRQVGGSAGYLMARTQGPAQPGICGDCYVLAFNNAVSPADIAIDRRINGVPQRLAMAQLPNVDPSGYRLRFSVVDNNGVQELRGYLNGALLISFDDSSAQAIEGPGGVSIGSYGVNWVDEVVADPLACTEPSPTATPSATATVSESASPSPTVTSTPTATETGTETGTPTATETATPSATPTVSETASPTSTGTPTPTTLPTPCPDCAVPAGITFFDSNNLLPLNGASLGIPVWVSMGANTAPIYINDGFGTGLSGFKAPAPGPGEGALSFAPDQMDGGVFLNLSFQIYSNAPAVPMTLMQWSRQGRQISITAFGPNHLHEGQLQIDYSSATGPRTAYYNLPGGPRFGPVNQDNTVGPPGVTVGRYGLALSLDACGGLKVGANLGEDGGAGTVLYPSSTGLAYTAYPDFAAGAVAPETLSFGNDADGGSPFDGYIDNFVLHRCAAPAPEGALSAARVLPEDGPKDQRRLLPQGQSLIVAPNPAQARARACFAMAAPGRAELIISNVAGERVLSLDLGERMAGEACEPLDLGGLASGVYLAQLRSDEGQGWRSKSLFKLAVVR